MGVHRVMCVDFASTHCCVPQIFAHGKDMYYDGWEDTVQINYGNPAARVEMEKILQKMASLADGVRCDMAMLLCEDVLEKTWVRRHLDFSLSGCNALVSGSGVLCLDWPSYLGVSVFSRAFA